MVERSLSMREVPGSMPGASKNVVKMSLTLSERTIRTIMSGGTVTEPIVQILGNRPISNKSSNGRYALCISDGVHCYSLTVLSSHLNPMIVANELVDNTIIKIFNHKLISLKKPGKEDKYIIVILEIEVLHHGSEVGMVIGNPKLFKKSEGDKPVEVPTSSNSISFVENRPSTSNKSETPKTSNLDEIEFYDATEFHTSIQPAAYIHPIANITPYIYEWVIKVRVTNKSRIRTWRNDYSEGKLFSVDLVDESGKIRATAFKEQVDQFYDQVEENKIYFVSNCEIKLANKEFSILNNYYEMIFNKYTQIVPCLEGDHSIPSLRFNFVTLNTVLNSKPNDLLEIIGVCKKVDDLETLFSRTTNEKLKRREILIVDSSLVSVVLTLWESLAENFNGENHPIVAVKGAKVKDYEGEKTLSLTADAKVMINPDIPEAHRLSGWFDIISEYTRFIPASVKMERKIFGKHTIREVIEQRFEHDDESFYFNCYANITFINREQTTYQACPKQGCFKKVFNQYNGQYRCEKCKREYNNFKNCFLLTIYIGDFTGVLKVTLFQKPAEQLLGVNADDVVRCQNENDAQYRKMFNNISLHSYLFRLKANKKTFNDQTFVNHTVLSVKKPNCKERCRQLITEIKMLSDVFIVRV